MAVKIVPIDNDLEEIQQEIDIMRQSDSDYIIKCYHSYVSRDMKHIWMAMEIAEGGSVNDLMFVMDEVMTPQQIREVAASAMLGLVYLHRKLIIHRDIKAGNILLNEKGQVKLADFGVSAVLQSKNERCRTAIGAPFWMAPEVIQEEPYDGRADVWSLGITMIEMAEARPPNAHIHPMRALFVIPTQPPPTLTEPDDFPKDLVQFTATCLTKAHDKRKTSEEMLKHPFIEKTVRRLQKEHGVSPIMEKLVRKALPAIQEFRNLDSDDSDDEEAYEEATFDPREEERVKANLAEQERKDKADREKVQLQQAERKEAERKEAARKAAEATSQVRRHASSADVPVRGSDGPHKLPLIRPGTLAKKNIKKERQTLKAGNAPVNPEGFIPKGQQNNMEFEDVKKMLTPDEATGGTEQELRDTFGATVMTKEFIHLLKKSKEKEPDLFDILNSVTDPEEAMEMAVAVLKLAVGQKPVLLRELDGEDDDR
ncbi:Serine/threonine-protein kinase 3 (Mammalian STE20-like protein kinase 2) (MST-2) (STE20-like kinase MST2) [Cleaved into: Serine/threonine-protein kinase 3 36kDa subunit (MST2/N) [Durusdinium trenchii]|uniref:Serine/threonine-protein kinase 3 (Mammalian STE20-like protein kinase 2) (MST-2) (STE20-like kinase MST2) [Cleaved into: Serine/threonine-protein kinase 3 36kDa subunit (MST2/N) n=1 Tax=Durusdinium trenchii TaxID=1381693 RepID=A0ABP0JBB6_9DINO